ncbi:CHAT domain-containing protein [Aquimarina sp. 433]
MKITLFFFLISIHASYTVYSQKDNKEFLKILNSHANPQTKEKKLDSFFRVKNNNYTFDIADAYHAYGVFLFKKRKTLNNEKALKKAIVFTKKSLEIKDSLKVKSSKSLDKTLFNLGLFNSRVNNCFAAVDYFVRLSEIGQLPKKISAYSELSEIYRKIGDYHKALNTTEKAIEMCPNSPQYYKKRVELYLLKADIYSSMGFKPYSEQIRSYLQKADSLLNLVSYNTSNQKTRTFQIEGNRLLKIKEYRKSIVKFSQALKGLPLLDSINRASTHNSLGLAFLKLKQLDSSKFHLKLSNQYKSNYTPAMENMGDLYIAKKEFTKALESYQKAIQYNIDPNEPHDYKDSIEIEDLVLLSNKYYTLSHLIQKANAWIQYYHHDQNKDHLYQAIKTFKIADQLVDIIRFESSEYRSKLYWRERASALYLNAVAASFLLNNHKDAYYFMEKNKAILLLEDITNEQAKENTKLPEDLANREFLLKQNIYLSENRLNTLTDTSEDALQKTKKEIYNHKKNYEVFVDSLHLLYPDYAINKQKIKVLPYDSFTSQFISDQEVVLQYILSEDGGYGIFHSRDQELFFKIPRVNELSQDITLLNKQVTNWFRNEEELKAYHKTAYQIFQKLIPSSVFSILKGKNITIIPDYALQQLSFETLITSDKDHSYLIKDVEIRYAYSMSYLDQNDQKERNAPLDFLGVAPVDFKIENLGSLVHSKKEITTITDILSGDVLLEEQGTKTNVLDSIDQYRIIHLSTHADIDHHTSPWIAFRNQKITLQEIYATKNQSEMVVLSACKTSLGELNKGEGVMSLARGFFHSGTNSVVSSLWSVNDKANQELMINFYKNIDQGLSKSSALRNAKLQYINSHDGSELSPFYWGSLILIGNNAPISFSNHLSSFLWITILLVIIGIIILIYFRKTRKS